MTYSISGAESLEKSVTLSDCICEQLLISLGGRRRAYVGGSVGQYKGFCTNDCAILELDLYSKLGCL